MLGTVIHAGFNLGIQKIAPVLVGLIVCGEKRISCF